MSKANAQTKNRQTGRQENKLTDRQASEHENKTTVDKNTDKQREQPTRATRTADKNKRETRRENGFLNERRCHATLVSGNKHQGINTHLEDHQPMKEGRHVKRNTLPRNPMGPGPTLRPPLREGQRALPCQIPTRTGSHHNNPSP